MMRANAWHWGRRATVLASLVAVLGLAGPTAYASPPPWTDDPFNYYAEKPVSVAEVLRDFAGSFSLGLDLSPQIGGKVNGRFQARNPGEFLDQLGSAYGFQWFTHAGTLFISRTSEMSTTSINASGSSMPAVRKALTSLGVLDARFGWGELPEQGLALVSGPPAYVALVQRTMASLPPLGGGQKVAVFRLKHASVDDRTITYRDRQLTTPGLARVLRALISGGDGGAATDVIPIGADSEAVNRLAAPLRASGNPQAAALPPSSHQLAPIAPLSGGDAHKTAAATAEGADPAASASARLSRPSIQADSRLNALIVQDTPDRLPMYQALIEQLDVPTALIEIEAMIIDVNSTRLDELGIAWGGRKGGVAAGFGDVSPAAGALTISGAARSANINTNSVVLDAGNYLVTRIRALEGIGEASIQSRPSILTIDHTGALLDLSETFYIRTTGERVATVTPVTVGTTLKVTPHYIERDRLGPTIQLDVDIEDGQIQDRQVDGLPTVRRSTVSTQAIVGESQTLLIGGYNTQQTVHSNDRIPVLGEIPLLGSLFSHKVDNRQVRERLFLIKPRVVALPESEPRGAGPAARIVAPPGREFPGESADAYMDDPSRDEASRLVNPPPAPARLPDRMEPSGNYAPGTDLRPASGEF
ncbi:type III secretion system outer membrane ring subunit SctC [Comamonas flocculans]|nr:type III secretion system outer membrane ring subunit SctC [Comamonas flocculans]